MDKWLSHPTSLKVISVIIGLLLWGIVHIDPDTSPQTMTSNVDTKTIEASVITTEGLDIEKYVLTAMEPSVVKLDVQGRLTDLFNASSIDDYIVKVDLRNVKAGIQKLPLTVTLPKGITLIEMSPRIVTVQIEEIVTKPFEPVVTIEGEPAEGHIVGASSIVAPTTGVQVTLPKDDMNRVGTVTSVINVDGADKTIVNKKAKIIVYDKEGIEMTNAIVSPETLHVEVKVTPPLKILPLQVRYTGKLPDGLSLVSVKPAIDKITVYGEQKVLDGLQVYDGAVLDLSKVKQSGTVQVKTGLVDGLKAIEHAEIAVEVVVASVVTKSFTGLNVKVEGIANGLFANIKTPADGKIDLTVSGAESLLNALSAEAIDVVANVEGLGLGTHVITLKVDVPPYIEIKLSEGQSLTVTIEITDSRPTGTDGDGSEEVGGTPTEESPNPSPTPTPENSAQTGNGSGNTTNGQSTN